MTQQWKIGAGIVGGIVLLGIAWWVMQGGNALPPALTFESQASSTIQIGGTAAPTPSGTITPVAPSSPAPALNRQVTFSAGLSAEVKQILSKKITDAQAALSKDGINFDVWMDLAINYKTAGDYKGAQEIWEYLSALYPGDPTVRHNLGDLYNGYYKDYAKAESYYKQAISLAPTQAIDYLALHEMYRYLYKQNTSAAVDILKTGTTRVPAPQVIDLYAALGMYYEAKKNNAEAIVYYTKARDEAKKAGNENLAAQFDAAITALKK